MVKIPKLSLRWILSFPFVLQTLVTVGLVGYLSYRSGKASVENLTQNLMLETGEHIHNYLNSYLQFAQKVNQANRDLIQSKIIDEKDFESLGRLFWQQIKNNIISNLSAFFLANLATRISNALFYFFVNRLLR